MNDAKAAVLAMDPDIFTPGPDNMFYGRFFRGGDKCQLYIRRMFAYAMVLAKAGTQQGLADALKVHHEMRLLDRGFAMGSHRIIPGLLIRLDGDQEVMTFVRGICAT